MRYVTFRQAVFYHSVRIKINVKYKKGDVIFFSDRKSIDTQEMLKCI